MLCREMARYRVSSARRVLHLSESDALARNDTLWPCVSLAMSVATPVRLAAHLWCLGSSINVGTVTDAFKDIQAFQTAFAIMVPFFTRILFETYKSERCFEHFSFVMDPIDAFPEHISTTVVAVTLPKKTRCVGICCSAGPNPRWHHLPRAHRQTGVCSVL
ncbi:hypothetical protein TNCV_1422821 [Trichonephila clavipes]|nr:hypothetical protein TNCV_1422821 [Trichonephila clavipes]